VMARVLRDGTHRVTDNGRAVGTITPAAIAQLLDGAD